MKLLFVTVIVLVSIQAQANVDCTFWVIVNGKRTDSKVELKAVNNRSGQYEAEKDGYLLTASTGNADPNWIQKISIEEKASGPHFRSVASYDGKKSETPEALQTGLLNELSKSAVLRCQLKK